MVPDGRALWLVFVAWGVMGCGVVRLPEGSGEMRVQVDGAVAEGRPVMLVVTVKNTGTRALTYWSGGPGNFPRGLEFEALVVTEGALSVQRVQVSNGQASMGTGGTGRIVPGESVEVPLALPPMGAGRYRVELSSSRWALTGGVVEVEVPPGEEAKAAFDKELVKQMESGNSLAIHVAQTWPTDVVLRRALEDVLSRDVTVLRRALSILGGSRRWVFEDGTMRQTPLPAGTAEGVVRAIERWTAEGGDDGVVTALGGFVESAKLEEGARALIPVVAKMPAGQGRMIVIRGIAVSGSAEATAALRGWLQAGDPWTRIAAASALARRHDVAAVPVLLEMAKVRVGRTGDAIYELSYFPDVPEVVKALEGMKGDAAFAEDAKRALKHMEEVRKQGVGRGVAGV